MIFKKFRTGVDAGRRFPTKLGLGTVGTIYFKFVYLLFWYDYTVFSILRRVQNELVILMLHKAGKIIKLLCLKLSLKCIFVYLQQWYNILNND